MAGTVWTTIRQVIVVDDHRDSADALATHGFQVRTAYAAMAAIQLARHFLPAAMILDIGMPARDGYLAARYVRGDPDLRSALLT